MCEWVWRPKKPSILETFGCQMNAHDSEKVIGTLEQQGYRQVETEEDADLILYNTCSIRDKAEQKVFNRLNDYKKLHKEGEAVWRAGVRGAAGGREDLRARAVCVAGVGVGVVPQAAGDAGAAGAGENAHYGPRRPADRGDVRDGVYGAANPYRGYITIIEGCDKFCAYCVVPYTRGKERSRGRRRCWPRRGGWRRPGTRRFSCWGRT
jgi:tRNA-2-methylthio-N6-dimethylallyladenosine synthase